MFSVSGKDLAEKLSNFLSDTSDLSVLGISELTVTPHSDSSP